MHHARMTYHRGSGALSGSIGGKLLHIVTRPARGSATLPAGDYVIHPPVVDPIYGMLALVVPAAGPSNPAGDTAAYIKNSPAGIKWAAAPAGVKLAPQNVGGTPANKYSIPVTKLNAPANKYSAPVNKLSAPANKYSTPANKYSSPAADKDAVLNEPAQVFVLSQKAIPGQNSIIVSSGFADLMDALHAAGGATVAVS